jgi:hypothetical protein
MSSMNKSCEKNQQQHIVKIFYMWMFCITLKGRNTFVFGFWSRYVFLVPDSCWATVRNSNRIYAYNLVTLSARRSQRTQPKLMKTTLVSALFRQFDSFFWTIDTLYVLCQKIYNSFPLAAKQVRKTRQNSYI